MVGAHYGRILYLCALWAHIMQAQTIGTLFAGVHPIICSHVRHLGCTTSHARSQQLNVVQTSAELEKSKDELRRLNQEIERLKADLAVEKSSRAAAEQVTACLVLYISFCGVLLHGQVRPEF